MSAGRLKNRDGTSSRPIETAVYWQTERAWVSLAAMLTDCDSCPGGFLMTPHADRRGPTRREVLAAGLAAPGMLVAGRPAVARPTGATGASEGLLGRGPQVHRGDRPGLTSITRGGSHKPPPFEGTEERQIRGPRTDRA